jgi:hypothetical protein
MPWKNIKLVERSENEPKFNSQNKTDRKILTAVIVCVSILTIVAVGLFILYFLSFKA